jgi:hypothetical protein
MDIQMNKDVVSIQIKIVINEGYKNEEHIFTASKFLDDYLVVSERGEFAGIERDYVIPNLLRHTISDFLDEMLS